MRSYSKVYRELEQTIRIADAQEDLRWFRNTSGPGMPMNWPQLEVRRCPLPNTVWWLLKQAVAYRVEAGHRAHGTLVHAELLLGDQRRVSFSAGMEPRSSTNNTKEREAQEE